jgi:hypothetical protein
LILTEQSSHWKKLKSKFSAAFSVEDESDWTPNAQQADIIEKLAKWVVNHRLTLPAVMTLESLTPLNYIGSQAMVFFQPFVSAFLNTRSYGEFQEMLEYRQSIQYMIQVLETREEAFLTKQKAEKAARRKRKSTGQTEPAKEHKEYADE